MLRDLSFQWGPSGEPSFLPWGGADSVTSETAVTSLTTVTTLP